MATESSKELLLSALPALSAKVGSVVERVRELYSASSDVSEFMEVGQGRGLRHLFSVTPAYAQCMRKVGVKSRVELEGVWARHYGDPEVREAVDALMEEEDDFHQLVAQVEKKLSASEDEATTHPPASVGQLLPKDLQLTEASSGQNVPLGASWTGSKFTLYVLLRHFG